MTNSCEVSCNKQEMCKCDNLKYTIQPEQRQPEEPPSSRNCPDPKKLEEDAFKVFRQAMQLFKPDEVMFSFNGGKDCTVVLHMLYHFFRSNPALKHIRLPVLYIQNDDAFEEVECFVNCMAKYYDINLIKQKGHIKEVLHEICGEMPNIKAVFMGCRRTDPYCGNLKVMQPTDCDYPPLMRINPILDWTCQDVWTYIRANNVPYCCLYNIGYTSLGNKKNTIPNPHLRARDPITCKYYYRPAYELCDCSLERAGRL